MRSPVRRASQDLDRYGGKISSECSPKVWQILDEAPMCTPRDRMLRPRTGCLAIDRSKSATRVRLAIKRCGPRGAFRHRLSSERLTEAGEWGMRKSAHDSPLSQGRLSRPGRNWTGLEAGTAVLATWMPCGRAGSHGDQYGACDDHGTASATWWSKSEQTVPGCAAW